MCSLVSLVVNPFWIIRKLTDLYAAALQHDNASPTPFNLEENGTVRINHGSEEEMDIAAERFAREMMTH